MRIFHDHMIKPPIREYLVSAVLNQIKIEREGFAINRSAVKSCVDVLLQLQEDQDGSSVYKKVLEPAILKDSEVFYAAEGQNLLNTCDAPEYLRRVCLLLRSILGRFSLSAGRGSASFGRRSRTSLPLRSHLCSPATDIGGHSAYSASILCHVYAELWS